MSRGASAAVRAVGALRRGRTMSGARRTNIASKLLFLLCFVGALLTSGCGRWLVTSDLRPPPNPLLDGPAPCTAPGPYTVMAPRTAPEPAPQRAATRTPRATKAAADPAADPATLPSDLSNERRAVVRALEAIAGQRTLDGRPATDLALVRAAFAPLGGPLATVSRLDDLPEHSARLLQSAQPGDLLFFAPDAEAPSVCVVRRRLPEGVLEAGCVARKAVRWVRVAPARPGVRRDGDIVLNTFLRPRRAEDPAGTAYLAGQRLQGARTPFRQP